MPNEVDLPVGKGWRRLHDLELCIGPDGYPCRRIECVDVPVLGRNIDHPVPYGWGSVNRFTSRIRPQDCPGLSIERVDVIVIRAEVYDTIGHCRRRIDDSSGREFPE